MPVDDPYTDAEPIDPGTREEVSFLQSFFLRIDDEDVKEAIVTLVEAIVRSRGGAVTPLKAP